MSRRHGGMAMLADKSRTRDTSVLLKIIWGYVVEMKKEIIAVMGIILVYTIAATYQPIIIQQALDLLFEDKLSVDLANLISLIVIFAILSAMVWIFQSLNTWIMAKVRTTIVDNIRKDSFNKLVKADMSYHHKNQSGNITSRVVGDSSEVASGLQVFTTTTTQFLLIIATFGVLISINFVFALVALLAIPVAFAISKFFGTIGKKRMLQTRQAYGNVSGKLAENLAGVSIAKAFNQEERVSAEIKELNDKSYEYLKQLGSVFILVFPSISMVSTLLVFGILVLGGYYTTFTSITVGTIFLGTVMVRRFLQPIIQLSTSYTQLQASLAAIDRIADVLEAEPSVKDPIDAVPLDINRGEIVFENLDFAYEDNFVLKQVNFTVSASKKTALVGHTGAGKTTLTSLLLRFYDPIKGRILIDGFDIRDVTNESLLANISLVSQEPYLFADTIIENIRYGKLDATDDDIYDLCTLLGADQFIDALPEGYQTVLQESGKSLSAGQRQMITIARTMLSDPVILVLDEATSRLDAYSESLVQNAQRILFEGRTTLIIAHRLSTIRDVDQIIVLDEGKVIEKGIHEELMNNKSKYFELYNMYYAHQGAKTLPDSFSVLEELTLINRIKERIAIYQEKHPNFSVNYETDKHSQTLNGESKVLIPIIDAMIQHMIRLQHVSGSSEMVKVVLKEENGITEIQMINPKLKLPEQMMKMFQQSSNKKMRMQGSPNASPSESFENQKSLDGLVKDLNGSFEMKSPIDDYEVGFSIIAKFPKITNLISE